MTLSYKACVDEHNQFLAFNRVLLDQAWTIPWDDICRFSIFGISEGVIVKDDEWIVPKSFVSQNYYKKCDRKINFTLAIPAGWARSETRSEHLLRRLKRIALLNMVQTVPSSRNMLRPPEPRTWVHTTIHLLKAARFAATLSDRVPKKDTSCPDPGVIFADLTPEAFDDLRASQPMFFAFCVQRLNGLFSSCLFDDWPAGNITLNQYDSTPIKHFSDEAFTNILSAAHFLADIQEDLEACFTDACKIERDVKGRRKLGSFIAYRNRQIAEWSGKRLYPGMAFPFSLDVCGEGHQIQSFSAWPLVSFKGLRSLLSLCQTANAIILNTATAGRASEMQTLSRDPLVKINGAENLAGYTFKESDDPKGTARHWPLPTLAVQAVKRQQSLLSTLGCQGEMLWATRSQSTTGIIDIGSHMSRFGAIVKTLDGMSLGDIDDKVTSHRFRYTMARLVGLSLEGASDVLYTVLGHKDKKSTLGYMLSDPDFRSDADTVRREVQHVRRQKLIKEANYNGGPAAETVKIAKMEMIRKAARLNTLPDDEGALIAILPEVHKVRNDIYCTSETAKQKGLCSEVTGRRDVGKCSPSCIFRLEASAAEQVHRQTIQHAMKQLQSNITFDGSRSYYQSQIVANMASFEKTLDSFVSDGRLKNALRGCDRRYFQRLPLRTRDKLVAYLENDR